MGSRSVPLGTMFTSYEIGKEKTFLHPLVVPMMVFLVVMVENPAFSTLTLSRVVVFVISKTLSGARSSGRRVVLVPASLSNSTRVFSLSSELLLLLVLSSELLEVKLETEALVVTVPFFCDEVSAAIKAARTSGAREDQASRIEAGRTGFIDAESSLNFNFRQQNKNDDDRKLFRITLETQFATLRSRSKRIEENSSKRNPPIQHSEQKSAKHKDGHTESTPMQVQKNAFSKS